MSIFYESQICDGAKVYKNTETMLFGIASAINTDGKKITVNG